MSGRAPRIRLAGVAVRRGRLLVVRHRRDGREYDLLPGGGLEWGETCAAGLAREFMEELSLRIRVGRLLAVNESIEPSGRRHIVNLTFHVRITGGALRVHRDPRLRAARWITRDELRRTVFYPDIRPSLLAAWDRKFCGVAEFLRTPWT